MIKIGFIGVYDKTDLILQTAKIIRTSGKRVLIIDSTINQKAKYIIPVIKPTKTYVTEFEEMDVAVGFDNFEQIKSYLGEENIENEYDYVLIDIDSGKNYNEFEMENARINFFVTSFDLYSLKKGIEILSGMKNEPKLFKVLISNTANGSEDEYVNFLATKYKINWYENKIYIPLTQEDRDSIIENQREAKIKFKNLSRNYKECLLYLADQILENENLNDLRKIMKIIEKGA